MLLGNYKVHQRSILISLKGRPKGGQVGGGQVKARGRPGGGQGEARGRPGGRPEGGQTSEGGQWWEAKIL